MQKPKAIFYSASVIYQDTWSRFNLIRWLLLPCFILHFLYSPDFPGGSDIKGLPTMWETQVQSLGREDPLEKEMAAYSSTLAWKIPQRSLVGYSPWDHKELDTTEWLHFLSWCSAQGLKSSLKCCIFLQPVQDKVSSNIAVLFHKQVW